MSQSVNGTFVSGLEADSSKAKGDGVFALPPRAVIEGPFVPSGIERVHPIKTLSPVQMKAATGWMEWLEEWSGCGTIDGRFELLHRAFKIRVQDDREEAARISFFFDAAEGLYGVDFPNWGQPGDVVRLYENPWAYGPSIRMASDARRRLAEKAYKELVLNALNTKKDRSGASSWEHIFWYHSEVMIRLLAFFRLDDRGSLTNLVDDYHDKEMAEIVRLCLEDLVVRSWTEYNRYSRSDADLRFMIGLRPWFIDVLYGLRRLSLLLKFDVDEASMEHLKELALRFQWDLPKTGLHYPSERRRPKDIREAIAAGSQAAVVWNTLDIQRTYLADYKRRRELKRQAEELLKEAEEPRKLIGKGNEA